MTSSTASLAWSRMSAGISSNGVGRLNPGRERMILANKAVYCSDCNNFNKAAGPKPFSRSFSPSLISSRLATISESWAMFVALFPWFESITISSSEIIFFIIVSPVSCITLVCSRQSPALLFTIADSIVRVIALIIGGMRQDYLLSFYIISAFSSSLMIFALWWYYSIAKRYSNFPNGL